MYAKTTNMESEFDRFGMIMCCAINKKGRGLKEKRAWSPNIFCRASRAPLVRTPHLKNLDPPLYVE